MLDAGPAPEKTGSVRSLVSVIAGVVVVLLGGVWTLQGSGVIGGSTMTGSTMWLVIGLVLVAAGAVLIAFGARPAGDRPGPADRR